MKKIKPYKVSEDFIFCRVLKPAQVTQKTISAVEWPAQVRGLCFDFRTTKLDPVKPLSFRLSPRYTAGIICRSSSAWKKGSVKPVPAAGIETRKPKSFAEFKKIARMDEKIFLKLWGKKMSEEGKKAYRILGDKGLAKIKPLIAFKGSRPVAVFGFLKHKGSTGKMYDAVTSWNLFPGLTPAEKRSAYYQAGLWLKKNAKRQVSVALGAFEKEPLKFFAGLGFTASRVVVERLGA